MLSKIYLIFIILGILSIVLGIILNNINSKKLKLLSEFEFKYILGLVSTTNKIQSTSFNFNFFSIYIKDENIYIVPMLSLKIFSLNLLSNAIYFEGKETQIINDLYFDSSNHLIIEYIPYDTFSLISRENSTIKIKNLNSQQKNILADYIEKHFQL